MIDEIKDSQGAIDLPDERDFSALHLFGDPQIELPRFVNLNVVPAHNQGKSMHCTAYALTHIEEILNTLEHKMTALADPEEQWANQRANRGNYPNMEKDGDSLQNALDSLVKYGLANKNTSIQVESYKIEGYARIQKTLSDFKSWLARGFPIYTGWNRHCFAIVAYNDSTQTFTALNSYGPKWGKKKDGTFDISYSDIHKLFTPYIIYDKKDLVMIFKDVSQNSPMAEQIKYCLENGLMVGYGADQDPKKRYFKPDQPVTRAELAAVVSRLHKQFKS